MKVRSTGAMNRTTTNLKMDVRSTAIYRQFTRRDESRNYKSEECRKSWYARRVFNFGDRV